MKHIKKWVMFSKIFSPQLIKVRFFFYCSEDFCKDSFFSVSPFIIHLGCYLFCPDFKLSHLMKLLLFKAQSCLWNDDVLSLISHKALPPQVSTMTPAMTTRFSSQKAQFWRLIICQLSWTDPVTLHFLKVAICQWLKIAYLKSSNYWLSGSHSSFKSYGCK